MPLAACVDDSSRTAAGAITRTGDRIALILPRARAGSTAHTERRHQGLGALRKHPLVTSPDFRRLFLGDVMVKVAERYFALTFAWWLLAGPHPSGARLGTLLTLESLSIVAVGALAGPLIDRTNKKWCMAIATLLQSGMVAVVAALMALDALSFTRLCIAAVGIGAMVPVFEAAAAAALPRSVSSAELSGAAALQAMTVEFSNVIAAAFSAIALWRAGFVIAVAINAGLYLLAAICLLQLRGSAFEGRGATRSYVSDLREGMAYIAGHGPVAAFVGIYVGELFLLVPLLVLIPMIVQSVRGGAVGWVAILETTFSIGAITTAVVLSLRDATRHLYGRIVLALAVLGIAMAVLARIDNLYAMVPDVAVMGACVAVLMGLSNALFQEVVPSPIKGRFFGVVETLGAAITPLAYAGVGLAFSWSGVTGVLIAASGGLVLLAVVALRAPRVALSRVRLSTSPQRAWGVES
jgi:MFS transporter, DHA3 family, macrolide efflux protein